MKAIFLICLFFTLSHVAWAQSHINKDYTCVVLQQKRYFLGLGIKAGDPMGLTMKGYFLKRFGIEVAGGLGMSGNNSQYVINTLREAPQFAGLGYSNHVVRSSYAAQARLKMHFPIPNGVAGLDWYAYGGYQMRQMDINYLYIFRDENNNRVTDDADFLSRDEGVEAGLGIEFAFNGRPFAFFAEIGAFNKSNGIQQKIVPLGGVGMRFNLAIPNLDQKPSTSKQMKGRLSKRGKTTHTIHRNYKMPTQRIGG